jgi:predicted ATPase
VIYLFESYNFRMLRNNRIELGKFNVLVGQNATGKSTFLAALQLIADILLAGLNEALTKSAGGQEAAFQEFCFEQSGKICLALEMTVPDRVGTLVNLRYELRLEAVGNQRPRISGENLFVLPANATVNTGRDGKNEREVYHTIVPQERGWYPVLKKTNDGTDTFFPSDDGPPIVVRFGPDRPALGFVPEDAENFALAMSVRDLLRDGVTTIALEAARLRAPSPPRGGDTMASDGSNLAVIASDLRNRDPILFDDWVLHVSRVIQGLEVLNILERPEDKHRILRALFRGNPGNHIPSWHLSDGTLRLLALTLLSYSATEQSRGLYLIEEPENGLHPLAIQSVYQALSNPPGDLQVFCATHSPIFMANVRLEDVLVFRRGSEGESVVLRGPDVPELASWKEGANLADLFAAGVLS